MTEFYAPVVIGTAATFLATILLLLRAKFRGRRPVTALARRWVATSIRNSTLVLALLSAIAVSCFASIPAIEGIKSSSGSAPSVYANAPSPQSTAGESASVVAELDSLRAYADKFDNGRPSTAANPLSPNSVELPDVDVMIAKLVARLENQPDDVKGWKMLGWSYLNTDRLEEAARAYETALKLEPGDNEIEKGLAAVRSAQIGTTRTAASDPAASPHANNMEAAAGQSDSQPDGMIRGMVDQLATRLEASPNDEDGWLRLVRSRMTLGERDAAKAALTKALETFAADAGAKARITAAAKELGVESN